MKKYFLGLALMMSGIVHTKPYIIDKIVAVIYHEEGNIVILSSDMKPGVDGVSRTLDQLIDEQLIILDAKRYQVSVSDDEIDRYIGRVQKENKLTQAQIEKIFADMGYTFSEAREQLRQKQVIEMMIDYKVKSNKRMMIQRDEVIDYYNNHPELHEKQYTLDIAFVPAQQMSRAELDEAIARPTFSADIEWQEPFAVYETELPDERRFITQKSKGDIVFVEEVDGGYEITRLVDITEPTLDDVYSDIALIMRRERYPHILEEYQQSLRKNAHIRLLS